MVYFFGGFTGLKMLFISIGIHCNGECSSLRIHYSETTYPGDFKLWNVVINIILNEQSEYGPHPFSNYTMIFMI